MYVCGRDMGGFGTVMPALAQAQQRGIVGNIHIAATRPQSIEILKRQQQDMDERLAITSRITGYPQSGGADPSAYRKVLQEMDRPACAIVVVPDHLHAEVTADVLRAGLHALVVKPLTPTVAEGQELIRLAQEHSVYGAVEFHKRFDEANLLMRQTVEDGRLGDLCYVSVEYSQRRTIPEHAFSAWAEQSNIFQYLGVHYVDLVYFATGARPVRAMATAQYHYLRSHGTNTPDAVQAMVEWEMPNGKTFVASYLTHWVDSEKTSSMSDQKITLLGTQGRFESNQKHRGVQIVTDDGIEDVNPYFTQLYKGVSGLMDVHGYGPKSIEQFLLDVRALELGQVDLDTLSAERPSFADALVATAVVEAVNKSLTTNGEWVPVPGVS